MLLAAKALWLFAGIWRIAGEPEHGGETYSLLMDRPADPCRVYPVERVPQMNDPAFRLSVRFRKTFRASCPNWKTCGHDLRVAALAEAPVDTPAFPGFRDVRVPMPLLRRVAN